jgi:hypothetical protein
MNKKKAEKVPAPEKPKPPVTLKELAQSSERLQACQEAHRLVLAQTEDARGKSHTRLRAAHNEWVELTARSKEQEAK